MASESKHSLISFHVDSGCGTVFWYFSEVEGMLMRMDRVQGVDEDRRQIWSRTYNKSTVIVNSGEQARKG